MLLPTTSLAAIFIFSFIVGFGAVISPGPISTAIVSQAPRQGWQVGPLVATGHAVLELVMVLALAAGLGALLAHPSLQLAIALIGGLLLAWMGASMLHATWRGKMRLPGQSQPASEMGSRRLVGLGMLATVSNPFWYAWWVTVAAGYLTQARAVSLGAILAFYTGHISADYLWDTLLSTVIGGPRRWMTNRLYQGLIVACGLFFIYLGWLFLSQGITLLQTI